MDDCSNFILFSALFIFWVRGLYRTDKRTARSATQHFKVVAQ